jgi:predicted site-specific integrase-resolvase
LTNVVRVIDFNLTNWRGGAVKGQRIGYVRVSTFDQNVDRQLEGQALDRTFTDKASGKDVNRPQLDAMLTFAREGDTVVVHSMDRWPAISTICASWFSPSPSEASGSSS